MVKEQQDILAPKKYLLPTLPFSYEGEMNLNSPLFDRIRTRRKAEQASARDEPARCDHEGCSEAGGFRAPKGRSEEGKYWNFCLNHVKVYNQSYNYFVGMSDQDVARYQKDSVIGHRPTWSMGANSRGAHANAKVDTAKFGDPFDLFADTAFAQRQAQADAARKPSIGPVALKALERLGLSDQATAQMIKTKFKSLVKQLHPDVNGGDRSSEEQLREIIDAYNTLKSAGLA